MKIKFKKSVFDSEAMTNFFSVTIILFMNNGVEKKNCLLGWTKSKQQAAINSWTSIKH